ncbi:MAG TPA: F0F1 ATP synthase subunit gamma, partial [Candidatus Aminicenantes bacterium]|nr:F0F1 ATP synthase subunit gamma [Candidatus Aminicenantes bacterium]
MSDTLASLRRKIGGAKDLLSVVGAMKALAASNISHYEEAVRALADYYRAVQLGLSVCFRDLDSGMPEPEENKQISAGAMGVVVFGSDQGLVGRFNDIVVAYAAEKLELRPRDLEVWAVGERVHARLQDAGFQPAKLFSVPNSVEGITPLIGQILLESESLRERDENAELRLFFNRHESGGHYSPGSQRLLPLDVHWQREAAALAWPTKNLPEIIDGGETTLRALIREYLFVSLFRACAESLASENASRLAAMQRAEKNIDELLENLNRSFHR